MEVLLKIGSLPHAFEKQPSIPTINRGKKKMSVKMMMMIYIFKVTRKLSEKQI